MLLLTGIWSMPFSNYKFNQNIFIKIFIVGFDVLAGVKMKSTLLEYDAEFQRRFGGTYYLHIQGLRENQDRNMQAELPESACCFLYSFFAVED
jgi:hypothetical protein